jgi:hypothetical protein
MVDSSEDSSGEDAGRAAAGGGGVVEILERAESSSVFSLSLSLTHLL